MSGPDFGRPTTFRGPRPIQMWRRMRPDGGSDPAGSKGCENKGNMLLDQYEVKCLDHFWLYERTFFLRNYSDMGCLSESK